MKYFKLLTSLILAVGIISCASPSLDHKITRSPAGRSIKGGADGGGGGDTQTVTPATMDEVKEAISNIPKILPMVLNYHEIVARGVNFMGTHGSLSAAIHGQGVTNRHLEIAYETLFLQHRDVYQMLNVLKFVPKESGPCEDTQNDHKDASAFNSVPNEICFSVERLTERLSRENLTVEILAIAAHEVTHRMGGDEEVASAIQKEIRRTLRPRINSELADEVEKLQRLFARDIELEIKNLISEANSDFPTDGLPFFCLQLGGTKELISQANFNVHHLYGIQGFSPIRLKALRALKAANIIALFTKSFCKNPKDDRVAFYYGHYWPRGQAFDLYDEGSWSVDITQRGHLAKWVYPRDMQSLRFNLEQIKTALIMVRTKTEN